MVLFSTKITLLAHNATTVIGNQNHAHVQDRIMHSVLLEQFRHLRESADITSSYRL